MATAGLFAAVFLGAAALTLGLRVPTFVHHDTSEAVMWGHSGWAAGFWKHPPLLPAIIRAWSYILPLGPLSLSLLTALNMTVCAWAVWMIARMPPAKVAAAGAADVQQAGTVAIILLACLPFTSVMAIKLNHNSVLIALWPLTVLAFLRAVDRPTMLRGALFGLAAAAAVLAKYYSLLLLAGCLAASFAVPIRAWKFYRGPAPYVAVATFALAMTPHLVWMLERAASPLAYAFNAGAANPAAATRGPAMALTFALQTPFLVLSMALMAWLPWRLRPAKSENVTRHRHERALITLTLVPFVLTIILVFAFNLRGAVAWAMPVFVCLPAVVAARIGQLPDRVFQLAPRIALIAIAAAVIAGQIGVRLAVARGADGISEPRREIAEAVTGFWHATQTGPLQIVAGDNRLTSAAVIFSPDHPQGWPSFSATQAPWIDPTVAAKSGFIALCRPADAACIDLATQASNGRAIRCMLKRRVEHLAAAGPWFEVAIFLVPAAASAAKPACPPE